MSILPPRTRANQLSIKFGTISNQEEHGDGPLSLCTIFVGVRFDNYDSLNWKQALFGERIPKKFGKKIKIWHLLRDIALWTIWIECNDHVFKHEQWHESKVKHQIWNELITYAKVAWEQVINQTKISSFSFMAMLQGFDQTWGARNVLCRRNTLHIAWNWKCQRR